MLSRRRLFATAIATYASAAVRRPHIVFILVDDLRWDELSCTGHPFASTPNADRLDREGANFRNAFASTPLCSPSRAAFLTSLYSHHRRHRQRRTRRSQPPARFVASYILHDAGYRTAFIGK